MLPGRNLPLSFWTPFNPTEQSTIYFAMYAFEVLCTCVCTAFNISTDLFVFVLFLVINFAFALLCERIEAIGTHNKSENLQSDRTYNQQDQSEFVVDQIQVYNELIKIIGTHRKFNR